MQKGLFSIHHHPFTQKKSPSTRRGKMFKLDYRFNKLPTYRNSSFADVEL
jgi:hypothetical protein